MFFLIKFFFYLNISYLILCFPIEKSTLFEHAYKVSSPITQNIYKKIKYNSKKIIKSGIQFSKDLFNNSLPKHLDKVNSSLSSVKKENPSKKKHLLGDNSIKL